MFIANAFSLSMFDWSNHDMYQIEVSEISVEAVKSLVTHTKWHSIVGHADTAGLFTNLLGQEVGVNRTSVTLDQRDSLVVGQYSGPRLPEGATELPEGASIRWLLVRQRRM